MDKVSKSKALKASTKSGPENRFRIHTHSHAFKEQKLSNIEYGMWLHKYIRMTYK